MEFTYEGLVRWGFGFHNPNHAAAAICVALPFLWGRGRIGMHHPIWMALTQCVGTSVLFMMLALTYSRTGFLVAALEVVIWAFLSWRNKSRPSQNEIVEATRPVVFSVTLVGLLLVVAVAGRVAWRFAPDASALNRPAIWWAGLKLAAANPWGVGHGNSGLIASAFLLDGIEVRTLVNSHLTLLAEHGWIAGCAWMAFMAFALVRGTRHARVWTSFAGLCLSAFSSSVFDWHVLFGWADMEGLGAMNFFLSWTLFAAFLAMGVRLAIGGRCDGDAACAARPPYHSVKLAAIVLVLMFAALWVTPTADAPKVRGGFIVKEGRDMSLVLRDSEWTLKAVAEYLSVDGGPDGYRLAIAPGYVPLDFPPTSVWLFGAAAESAWRFPSAKMVAVSPPEFCNLPPGVRILQ